MIKMSPFKKERSGKQNEFLRPNLWPTMEESFTKHLPFSLLAKNLFYDPDPALLAKQGGGAKD